MAVAGQTVVGILRLLGISILLRLGVMGKYIVVVEAIGNTVGNSKEEMDKTIVVGCRGIAILPVGIDHRMAEEVDSQFRVAVHIEEGIRVEVGEDFELVGCSSERTGAKW